jgi:hypothetical protein
MIKCECQLNVKVLLPVFEFLKLYANLTNTYLKMVML